MAIVVTALGTAQDKADNGTWTAFSSITLATGDALILTLAADPAAILQVSWNSVVMTSAVNISNAGNVNAYIYQLINVTGGTGNVVIIWQSPFPTAQAASLYKVTGLASTPLDQTDSSTGTSTTPTSTQTLTLAQTDELLVGCIGTEGPDGDAAGTWDAGANQTTDNGQRLGTTGAGAASNITVASATKIVTATTGGIASKTGIDSRDWGSCIATYKADTGPQVTQPYYVRTGGVPHMRIGRPGSIFGRSW